MSYYTDFVLIGHGIIFQFQIAEDERAYLTIANVSYDDMTWYTCVAGNSLGQNHRTVWLEVVPGELLWLWSSLWVVSLLIIVYSNA